VNEALNLHSPADTTTSSYRQPPPSYSPRAPNNYEEVVPDSDQSRNPVGTSGDDGDEAEGNDKNADAGSDGDDEDGGGEDGENEGDDDEGGEYGAGDCGVDDHDEESQQVDDLTNGNCYHCSLPTIYDHTAGPEPPIDEVSPDEDERGALQLLRQPPSTVVQDGERNTHISQSKH
jgi:hypothetical protein